MTLTIEREATIDLGAPVIPIPETQPALSPTPAAPLHDILIINYSGELEKTWATMLLASTAGAMGIKTKVFVTFWALQTFVKDSKRITGQNWMQKMLSFMQRPGINHRKLSKMNFLGMGPWMIGTLARKYKDASPAELRDIAMSMGVEFIPCQMTMELYGLTQDDLIEGMGEPVGAATVIGLMNDGWSPLFI
jgi:peroxiredoxin family protein